MPRYSENEQALIITLFNYFQREKDVGKTLLPLTAVCEVSNKAHIAKTLIMKVEEICFYKY